MFSPEAGLERKPPDFPRLSLQPPPCSLLTSFTRCMVSADVWSASSPPSIPSRASWAFLSGTTAKVLKCLLSSYPMQGHACRLFENPGLMVSLCCLKTPPVSCCLEDIGSGEQPSPLPVALSHLHSPKPWLKPHPATHNPPRPHRPAPSTPQLCPTNGFVQARPAPFPDSLLLLVLQGSSGRLPQSLFLCSFSQKGPDANPLFTDFALNYTKVLQEVCKALVCSSGFSTRCHATSTEIKYQTLSGSQKALPSCLFVITLENCLAVFLKPKRNGFLKWVESQVFSPGLDNVDHFVCLTSELEVPGSGTKLWSPPYHQLPSEN